MKGDEKQRKFHEALLKLLYPPSSSYDSNQDGEDEEAPEEKTSVNLVDDPQEEQDNDEGRSLPSRSDGDKEEHDCPGKLTRAQRKRRRKKKLKEVSSQRRKIIGPMLPDSNNHHTVEIVSDVPKTTETDAADAVATDESSGKLDSFSKQSKVKHRRKSKKIAAGKNSDLSSVEISGSPRIQATNDG